MTDLSGKTAFITGGTGVIGTALCREFLSCGANVAIADITPEKGLAMEAELAASGAPAVFVYTDITDKRSVEAAAAQIINRFGKIDILVNNAGYNTQLDVRANIADMPDEEWQKGININLNGTYNCSKCIAAHMVEQKYGRIVNIASILGQVPLRNQSPYSTAKAAIINLTKSMAMELAEYNILVNCVSPGSIAPASLDPTAFFFGNPEKTHKLLEHIPLHRCGRPEEIAEIVAFASSDDISFMTGNNITVDGGWISGDVWA